jgi:serine/threonine protein kinase
MNANPPELHVCPICASPVKDGLDKCTACGVDLASKSHGDSDALSRGSSLSQGKYVIQQVLGRGAFGITYLGRDERLKRPTAIKEFFLAGSTRRSGMVFPPPTVATVEYDVAIQQFEQEARILARFRNPSIVNVHDVFREGGTAYMVMDYLSGETLAHLLQDRGGPIAERELLGIVKPLAAALDQIHAEGLLHRDIKPDNIVLVSASGTKQPVLIDFGAAREFSPGQTLRQSIVLTPGYAPLEQYAEHARRGPATDIYALAATVYHLATGVQPPAATDRITGVLLKPARTINPAVGEQFSRALTHGLELKIDDRPSTAGTFYGELAAAGAKPLNPLPPSPPPSPQPPSPPNPAGSKRRWLAVPIMAVLAVVLWPGITSRPTQAPAQQPTPRPTLQATGAQAVATVVGNGPSSLSPVSRPASTPTSSTAASTGAPSPAPPKQFSAAPSMQIDRAKHYAASMVTSMGTMTADLFASDTPATVNSFVFLARQHFYDGVTFHRVINNFMVQTGDPSGTGTGGPGYRFNDEPVSRKYVRGTLAMANAGPNTNGSQFFILHKDYPLPPSYTIFGQLTDGFDTLDKIATSPTGPGKGWPDTPRTAIIINSVTINET